MKVGYARVSRKEQRVETQIEILVEYGCEKIFSEYASGAKNDRKELDKLLKFLRKGDQLVVWKLDRLGRSTSHLLKLSESLESQGIELKSMQDGIDTSTSIGKFFFTIMAAIATFERDLIIERTMAGLESARARGRLGGRPEKLNKQKEFMLISSYKSKKFTIKEICQTFDISQGTLYRYIGKEKESKGFDDVSS
tara:strand:+ start:229 stop:813 length:585 start_codon:yes stop_codon:yes gene_type:complete